MVKRRDEGDKVMGVAIVEIERREESLDVF